MLIFIIGMPASGKSTFGKAFAKKINYEFIDLDAMIVSKEGKSIAEIFSTKGEIYFRELETKALHSLENHKDAIISTGGGTPCFFDNMEFIKKIGISVFLLVEIEKLTERILADGDNIRPIFKNKTQEEILHTLSLLFESRKPYYLQADFIRTTDFSKLF